ncbi:MAG: hypothetical protein DCF30_15495 [Hyphomicrobiales bacterium]|nr:MAG: hypothetical protein DCF30_15495 [Hyphomicrobiales bacterium]
MTTAVGALIYGVFIDGLALSLFLILYWLLCPVPALFVALCIIFADFLCNDVGRSEKFALMICAIFFGVVPAFSATASLMVVACWAVIGFLSAVVALIMTKDLRLASYLEEPAR